MPFEQLKTKLNLTNKEIFRYLQLKSWITTHFELNYDAGPSIIEKIFMNSGEKWKLIGKVYNCLIEAQIEEYSLQKNWAGIRISTLLTQI